MKYSPNRTGIALLAGAILGFSVALSSGVLADRSRSAAALPHEQAALLAEVVGRIEREYVEPVDERELMDHAIRGMVSGLDPYSVFMDEAEFEDLRIATGGNYSGIGIEVTLQAGTILVITPLDGSPADRAGIQPGDVIVSIDGRLVEKSGLADSVARMRGTPGSIVRLTVERPGEAEPVHYAIARAQVEVHSVRQRMLEPGYGYLRISQFSETTGEDVERALIGLRAEAGGRLNGLVLDLRNNPGGVLDAAVEVSDAFLERGMIVTAEGRSRESRFRMSAKPGDLIAGAPIAVLVNGGSASAAEIVAGALRDNGRATLLGRRTFGKGSVQTVLPLSDGQALKLTTSRYFTPSGATIHGRGLAPDVELPRSAGPVTRTVEGDAELRAALDFLKNRVAPARVAAMAGS